VRPIKASDVALALVGKAVLDEPGRQVLGSAELRGLANEVQAGEPITSHHLRPAQGITESSVA
jgi:hypothetical protein